MAGGFVNREYKAYKDSGSASAPIPFRAGMDAASLVIEPSHPAVWTRLAVVDTVAMMGRSSASDSAQLHADTGPDIAQQTSPQ